MSRKKPLTMKKNLDVNQLFSQPSGQINAPITEILAPLRRLPGKTGQNQPRPYRHKVLWQRETGGCEREVSGPTTDAGTHPGEV